MSTFDLVAILTTLAAVLGWVNHRFLRLPTTIGLMVLSMVFSLALVALGKTGIADTRVLIEVLEGVDFGTTLLNGMLGALLFAGALHININDLRNNKWVILLLATAGVLTSTVLVGTGAWYLFRAVGLDVPYEYSLLFGALISPTDPIAVGAILGKAGVPKSLLMKITGESLFNDGVGVVVFLVILELVGGGHGRGGVGVPEVLNLLGVEVLGGVAFGSLLGWLVYRMLKAVDAYQVEILLTLAVVTGGYSLAQALHVSGPLAMVVAGLFIGNHGRAFAMSEKTVDSLDSFWELCDEFLNSVLFVMIGIEVLILEFEAGYLAAGLLAIPLVLLARFISVSLPVQFLRKIRTFSPHAIKILTWSGLRGGISVALALSLPHGEMRNLLVAVTYVVVTFSIVGQGLTVGTVARKLSGPS